MGSFIIDKTYDPIIFLKVTGKLNIKDFSKLSAEFDQMIADGRCYAAIFDMRQASGANDPRIGMFWTEWGRPIKYDVKKYCVGVVTVIKSVLLKRIASAILRFIAPPHPANIENNMETALWEINKWAEDKGVELPEVDLTVWEKL